MPDPFYFWRNELILPEDKKQKCACIKVILLIYLSPCEMRIIPRRGVRVVEGARLESVYTRKGIEGSNPSLSAYQLKF
jgi:hypothetical protein